MQDNESSNFPIPYRNLYDRLPGFAYRSKILKKEDNGLYKIALEIANEGCVDLLGASVDQLVGKNAVEQITCKEDLTYLRKKTAEVINSHRPIVIYYRIIPIGSKEAKWVREQTRCVYSPGGTPLYTEGFITDVNEEKLYELNLEEENKRLQKMAFNTETVGDILGKSKKMQHLYNQIKLAAGSDASIILYGETGSGKDLTARTLHQLGGATGSFVPVNCGAIPEPLMESEFFGHTKGAFSGAYANREGFLAAADKGTLFLDEIGELPLHLQVKLLRALETKSYSPVGGNTLRQSSFRLISATNRDLKNMMREGKMRPDFYYRIHVLTIEIPPLRQRMEDMPLLAHTYLKKKGASTFIPPTVGAIMERYEWPGNVRELYNFLDRFIVFGSSAVHTLSASLARRGRKEDAPDFFGEGLTFEEATRRFEKQLIQSVLSACEGNVKAAAEKLDMSLRTLQRKIKLLNLGKKTRASRSETALEIVPPKKGGAARSA